MSKLDPEVAKRFDEFSDNLEIGVDSIGYSDDSVNICLNEIYPEANRKLKQFLASELSRQRNEILREVEGMDSIKRELYQNIDIEAGVEYIKKSDILAKLKGKK